MAKIITENDIENAIIQRLCPENFTHINADMPANQVLTNQNILSPLQDGTGRKSLKEVVLPSILLSSLQKINPQIPEYLIQECIENLRAYISQKELEEINYDNYKTLKEGIRVEYEQDGKKQQTILRLIDFNNIHKNDFTLVSQMWIKGEFNHRRPDLLVFINGLPLVFIELKNSDIELQTAYNDNLKNYIQDIPQLFYFNQFCVLSNAIETRLGSFKAGYEHFFEWFRINEEDTLDRKEIKKTASSIDYLLEGLFNHENLLDYIENFILYESKRIKIIAKNHQFLGVNNAVEQFKKRKELDGKLGVFWHTQGSGKSYSMAFFVNKINRKIKGNFTFLLITDRVDLDGQLYKNFLRTEVVTKEESAQPKDSRALREFLQSNKAFIFTLIHKFRYDKNEPYPILSERDDIVVLVDEAHRTQYKDLAENMRTGLPNAGFIAFTGTPLLGSKRLTNQWFGDYVSEYNFAQSIEDGATVPLYYSRRVPEVALINTDLDDDYLEIIEKENLTSEEEERLNNYYGKTNEVIKRDDRLNKVAKDIAKNFPSRGYLGKAMVVSVDKFTAIRMYNKVQHYWELELQELMQKRSQAQTPEEKQTIKTKIDFMKQVEMAVVLSKDNEDEERYKKEKLEIQPHWDRMEKIDENGHDIEDNFKNPQHPLSLVFLCAMWLTGFDAPSVSTIYLDKPMKGHTLMQAIARVNRVYPGKTSGLVVDYLNLFKSMKSALGDYAKPDDSSAMPVKDISVMLELLNKTIKEAVAYCKELGIDFDTILETTDALDRTVLFKQALNILLDKDDYKAEFKIYSNLIRNIYDSSKPEVFELEWSNPYLSPILYLDGMIRVSVKDEKIEYAKIALAKTLDLSVKAQPLYTDEPNGDYELKVMKTINLSEINIDDVKKIIQKSPYKNIEIQELRQFIEEKLQALQKENKTRISFAERYKSIIDKYNVGNSTNENYFEDLINFVDELKKEDERHIKEGLTKEELELFDLLKKDKLTAKEEEAVKLSAKKLYETIIAADSVYRIVDWYKDEQPRQRFKSQVEKVLDTFLPKSYSTEIFKLKTDLVFHHILEETMLGRKYAS